MNSNLKAFKIILLLILLTSGSRGMSAESCYELFDRSTAGAPGKNPSDLFSNSAIESRQVNGMEHFEQNSVTDVMDYFIAGIYLNALLIEAVDKSAVPHDILERAHKEYPRRKWVYAAIGISEVISEQNPIRNKTIVYRGQRLNSPRPANGQMYQVGEELVYPQFLSTSPSPSLAESYGYNEVFLKIEVPAGAQFLNVSAFMGMPTESAEFLFETNSKLTVTAVEKINGRTIVSATLTPGTSTY